MGTAISKRRLRVQSCKRYGALTPCEDMFCTALLRGRWATLRERIRSKVRYIQVSGSRRGDTAKSTYRRELLVSNDAVGGAVFEPCTTASLTSVDR